MDIRTIGRARERATHPRLMRFARGIGARVPCDRSTVQATVQSATTAGCSHSRWVDPHVSYVHPHHRSDPRAGYTHTAHAACAWGWGPGPMRSSHGATHRPIRNGPRPRFPVASTKAGCDRRVPKRPRPGKFRPSAMRPSAMRPSAMRPSAVRPNLKHFKLGIPSSTSSGFRSRSRPSKSADPSPHAQLWSQSASSACPTSPLLDPFST